MAPLSGCEKVEHQVPKLDTDWESLPELLADIEKFMRGHPSHVIIPADSNGRFGWCAFIDTPPFTSEEDYPKEWTILVSNVKKGDLTVESSLAMCRKLSANRWSVNSSSLRLQT